MDSRRNKNRGYQVNFRRSKLQCGRIHFDCSCSERSAGKEAQHLPVGHATTRMRANPYFFLFLTITVFGAQKTSPNQLTPYFFLFLTITVFQVQETSPKPLTILKKKRKKNFWYSIIFFFFYDQPLSICPLNMPA